MSIFMKGKSVATEQPPKKISEQAIAFGQHIFELEEALTASQQRLALVEQKLREVTADFRRADDRARTAEREKEKFSKRLHEMKARLKSSAAIILDAMREDAEDVVETFRPNPESVRSVEKALATNMALEDTIGQKPLPTFLAAGPKEQT